MIKVSLSLVCVAAVNITQKTTFCSEPTFDRQVREDLTVDIEDRPATLVLNTPFYTTEPVEIEDYEVKESEGKISILRGFKVYEAGNCFVALTTQRFFETSGTESLIRIFPNRTLTIATYRVQGWYTEQQFAFKIEAPDRLSFKPRAMSVPQTLQINRFGDWFWKSDKFGELKPLHYAGKGWQLGFDSLRDDVELASSALRFQTGSFPINGSENLTVELLAPFKAKIGEWEGQFDIHVKSRACRQEMCVFDLKTNKMILEVVLANSSSLSFTIDRVVPKGFAPLNIFIGADWILSPKFDNHLAAKWSRGLKGTVELHCQESWVKLNITHVIEGVGFPRGDKDEVLKKCGFDLNSMSVKETPLGLWVNADMKLPEPFYLDPSLQLHDLNSTETPLNLPLLV